MPFTNTGTLLLTVDGRIAFASTYFCDLVGIEHSQAAGQCWLDFVFPEDLYAARELIGNSKRHQAPLRFRLQRLDGAEVWTDIQIAHLQTADGNTYAVTATITRASASASLRAG